MKTAVFCGQGSQKLRMGYSLYNHFSRCQSIMDDAEQILGYCLKEIVFGDDPEILTDTSYAQPALFVTGLMYVAALEEQGHHFTACAGHSLGEYTALVFAKSLSFEEGLQLVQKRGSAMKKAADGTGTMAAVIGYTPEELDSVLVSFPNVQIANINSDDQIVISGEKNELQAVSQSIKAVNIPGRRIRVISLKVSGPFHSAMMKAAQTEMRPYLQSATFQKPQIPIVMNVSGNPETDPNRIRELLIRQIVEPVQWVKTLHSLSALGSLENIELGPGNTLTGLSRKTQGAPNTIESDILLASSGMV